MIAGILANAVIVAETASSSRDAASSETQKVSRPTDTIPVESGRDAPSNRIAAATNGGSVSTSGARAAKKEVIPSIEWASLPLDPMGGLHSFGDEGFGEFQEGLVTVAESDFLTCARTETLPREENEPVIWDATFEFRLEPVDAGYVIRDVITYHSRPAIAELDDCYRTGLIGKTVPFRATIGPVRLHSQVRMVLKPKNAVPTP